MSDALRAALIAIHSLSATALSELGYDGSLVTVENAKLAEGGEYTPAWLVEANRQLLAKWPDGYTSEMEPGFDGPDLTRQRLVLIGAILDPRILKRGDVTEAQKAAVQHHCNNRAYGLALASSRDEKTGTLRLMACWVPGELPEGAPATGTIALPPNAYASDSEVQAAVMRWYEIARY